MSTMTDTEYQEFEKAFIAALLWSSTMDDETPFDEIGSGIADFDLESAERLRQECRSFLAQAGERIQPGQYSQAGHDFALTRNHHGAGFWDRAEVYGKKNANKLTELAHTFMELNLYTNDGVVIGAE